MGALEGCGHVGTGGMGPDACSPALSGCCGKNSRGAAPGDWRDQSQGNNGMDHDDYHEDGEKWAGLRSTLGVFLLLFQVCLFV